MIFVEVVSDDLGIGRKGDSLSHAQKDTHQNQCEKAVQDSSDCRGRGPKEKSSGKNPLHFEPVGKPTCGNLQTRIGPEKSGKQNSELRGRKSQFALKQGSGNRKIAAIDIVEKDGEPQQQQHATQGWRNYGTIVESCGRHESGRTIV